MGNIDHDLIAALRFFQGKPLLRRKKGVEYARPTDGVAHLDYDLPPDEDRRSREAIVRVLKRDNPPRQMLDVLAGVFAPDGPQAGARRVDLKFRKGGRPPDVVRNAHIIALTAMALKSMSLPDAQAAAASITGLDEEAVKSIWERNRALREAIVAAMPPQN